MTENQSAAFDILAAFTAKYPPPFWFHDFLSDKTGHAPLCTELKQLCDCLPHISKDQVRE